MSMSRGAPRCFSNVKTYNARVIKYWIILPKKFQKIKIEKQLRQDLDLLGNPSTNEILGGNFVVFWAKVSGNTEFWVIFVTKN
jgi:hypothetical protein